MIPRYMAPAGAVKSQEENATTMAKKIGSVLVAVLTLAERDGWVAPGLAGWLAAMKCEQATGKREVRLGFHHEFKPYDHARNALAKEFLASGYDWLLMLDNDMIPPPDLIEMIDRADECMDILVPRFYALNGAALKLSIHQRHLMVPVDQTAPLINLVWKYLGIPDGGVPKDIERREWFGLECAGSAAMFIRRRVFERLSEPFFRFVYDEKSLEDVASEVRSWPVQSTNALNWSTPAISEDFYFCLKARAAGFRVWGNRQFEVDHMKTVSLGTLTRIFGGSPLADKSKLGTSPETVAPAQPQPTANANEAARVGGAAGEDRGC